MTPRPTGDRRDVLTGIPPWYTTGDTDLPESDEMNRVIVKTFLETLAEVSLAVVTRQEKEA